MPVSMPPEEMAQYVDQNAALARVRGNVGLYRRMLGLFESSEEFAALEAALQAGDIARAGEVVHGIKGMTGNLSLNRLFETSTRLMDAFRRGERDEQLIGAYRDALEKTRAIVREMLAQPPEGA